MYEDKSSSITKDSTLGKGGEQKRTYLTWLRFWSYSFVVLSLWWLDRVVGDVVCIRLGDLEKDAPAKTFQFGVI